METKKPFRVSWEDFDLADDLHHRILHELSSGMRYKLFLKSSIIQTLLLTVRDQIPRDSRACSLQNRQARPIEIEITGVRWQGSVRKPIVNRPIGAGSGKFFRLQDVPDIVL